MLKRKNINGLIKALKHKNRNVRINATEALGKIKDPRTVEPLILALKDKDSDVRSKVAKALDKLNWNPSDYENRYLEECMYYYLVKGSINKCVSLGNQNIEPLILALKDNDRDTRLKVVCVLGKINDQRAIEALIQAFKDDDIKVQRHAIKALVKIGEPAVEPLIRALDDDDDWVQTNARNALSQINDPRADKALTEHLFSHLIRLYNEKR